VGIGYGVDVGGDYSVGVGPGVNVAHTNCIVLGRNAVSTAASQFVVGSSDAPISAMYLGKGKSSTAPTAVRIQSTDSSLVSVAAANLTVAAGTGAGGFSSVVGGDLTLEAGASGGSLAYGGKITLRTATGQTLYDRMVIERTGQMTMTSTDNGAKVNLKHRTTLLDLSSTNVATAMLAYREIGLFATLTVVETVTCADAAIVMKRGSSGGLQLGGATTKTAGSTIEGPYTMYDGHSTAGHIEGLPIGSLIFDDQPESIYIDGSGGATPTAGKVRVTVFYLETEAATS